MSKRSKREINLDYFKQAVIALAELGYASGYITQKALDAIKKALQ